MGSEMCIRDSFRDVLCDYINHNPHVRIIVSISNFHSSEILKELKDLVNLFFEVFSGAAPFETKSHPPADTTKENRQRGLAMNYDFTSFSTFAGEVSSQDVEDFWATFSAYPKNLYVRLSSDFFKDLKNPFFFEFIHSRHSASLRT